MTNLEILNFFLDLDFELCGFMRGKEIYIDNLGSTLSGRMGCLHSSYEPIIWHTHPITSKAYPSSEDILKIIKNDSISISYIITSWGIFSLFSGKKEKERNKLSFLKIEIDQANNRLYYETERGRTKRINLDIIDKYLSDLKEILRNYNFEIIFHSY